MKARILIAAALLLAVQLPALAANAELSWQNPIEYVDGSPMAPTDLKETLVEWGRCDGNLFPANPEGSKRVPGPLSNTTVNGLAPNVPWCFRAAAIDIASQQSDWSNVAQLVIVLKPRPPKWISPAPVPTANVVIQ